MKYLITQFLGGTVRRWSINLPSPKNEKSFQKGECREGTRYPVLRSTEEWWTSHPSSRPHGPDRDSSIHPTLPDLVPKGDPKPGRSPKLVSDDGEGDRPPEESVLVGGRKKTRTDGDVETRPFKWEEESVSVVVPSGSGVGVVW